MELLLAHADDDHAPALAKGLPRASAATAPRPRRDPLPPVLRHDGRDPCDLSAQRWGIVAPEGASGEHLLDLVAPLCRAREEAQGAPARVYRVPSGMDAEDASRWIDEVYWDEETPERDLPRYLLVLGEPHEVSFEVQTLLASQTFVGRLGLACDAAYAAYVDKIISSERGAQVAGARALFCAVADGTAATAAAKVALLDPVIAEANARHAEGDFPAARIVDLGAEGRPSPRGFIEQAGQPHPSLLLTSSHGLGAPRGGWLSNEQQRSLQGAMSFGPGPRVAACDVVDKPFLPMGMWVFQACFSAGVPSESHYAHWLSRLKSQGAFGRSLDAVIDSLPKPGESPFLSALPQTLLGKRDGPLAVIGHVDLAWSYGFQDLKATSKRARPSRFHGVIRSIVEGGRAGVAHQQLLRFFPKTSVELSTLYDLEARGNAPLDEARRLRKAHLWMLRNDLAGYVLLGDPAARLPLATDGAAPAAAAQKAPRLSAILGFSPREDASGLDAAKKYEAVRALHRGEAPTAIAARYGVSEASLSRWAEAVHRAGLAALEKTL